MSDGRKRLSGAAYKKARLEKQEKEQEAIKKTANIRNFFRKQNPESHTTSEEKNFIPNVLCPATSEIESSTLCKKETSTKKQEEEENVMPQTSSTLESSEIDEDLDSMSNSNYDPAVWPITELTREKVLKNGINQDLSKLDFSRSIRFIGGQNRCLSKTLFQTSLINGQNIRRSYLMYSNSSGKLYCVPCQLFGGVSKLAKTGFDDWKHGNDHLKSHENSPDHKSCVLTMKKRMTITGRVDSQLLLQVQDEEKYWQNVLKRVVAVVRSLAVAGLPLRGHFERFGSSHNCGNFIMCAELISEFDPFLSRHIAKYGNPGQGHTSYLSSSTYEKFLKIMSAKVTQEIIKEIKYAKYFSLIIDSTPDIAHVDQLAVIIRHVSRKGLPTERFLCFLPNVGHKAEELFEATMNILEKHDIDIGNCRGQSYDNASNMSGQYTGLQARIKERTPTALYSPCSAHSLNLVGEHATGSCKESRDFFSLLNNLYNFFSSSTKRWEVLSECLTRRENLSLKTLSKTRWSARDDACKALNKDWDEVMDALRIIANSETEKSTTRSEAACYLRQLSRLETAFLSVLWGDVLSRFNASSKKLQSRDIDVSVVSLIYESLVHYLAQIREEFDLYEEKALRKSEVLQYEDELTRKKKRKIHADETREGEVELVGRQNFKITTFNIIIDRLINEMKNRKIVYNELNIMFGFLTSAGTEDLDSHILAERCTMLCNFYKNDLPTTEVFVSECNHFFGFLKGLQEYPKSVFDLFKVVRDNELEDLYPYVDIALRLFLTIPASNCSAERSFSALKRIKNYMRSTMTMERLNDLAILTIESEITKKLDFDDIINSFSTSSARKKLV